MVTGNDFEKINNREERAIGKEAREKSREKGRKRGQEEEKKREKRTKGKEERN